ncbi:MAG: RagB/SusD family nutrient uptake outer membrane protein [Deinococcales bacterium]|nr:RagB/SusD family nutrient uptake outer membrane protein [Chitinophagaceae bacterium]
MKYKIKNSTYLIAVSLLICMAGCQKLDREIITDVNLTQIEYSFTTVSNLLNAAYAQIPSGFANVGGTMLAATTDDAEFTSETSTIQNFNNGNWNAISNPDNAWGGLFQGIRRVNIFLVSTDSIILDRYKYDPSSSQQLVYQNTLSDIKRMKYEGRFVRAYLYFELIKRYGGVPIFTEAKELSDVATIERSSLQKCIQFISDDCDSAAANLPATYTADLNGANTNAANLGRATKGAALALKARLLLYAASDLFNMPSLWAAGYAKPELISLPVGDRNARWKAAADAAKAVIDLSIAGYAQFNNYSTLFRAFNNAEIILTKSEAASNSFEITNYPIGFDKGQSGLTPSQNLVDAYEMKTNGAGIAETGSGYDPLNPYLNRDPRLGFSVVFNNSALSSVAGVTRAVQLFYGGKDGKPINNASKTGYYLRKYVNESLNLLTGNTAVHSWILFRLPEMWLNYAEALNEYNPGNTDIKIYYDRNRNRPGVLMPGLPANLNQDLVRQKIRTERRIEFAFEDHRPWDVRRWMIAPATLGGILRGTDIAQSGTNFTFTPTVVETRIFQPKMYLYPIPQSELNISPKFVQNPLW